MPYDEQLARMSKAKDAVEKITHKPMQMFGSRYFAYDENTLKAADALGVGYVLGRGTAGALATIYAPREYKAKIISVSNVPFGDMGTGSSATTACGRAARPPRNSRPCRQGDFKPTARPDPRLACLSRGHVGRAGGQTYETAPWRGADPMASVRRNRLHAAKGQRMPLAEIPVNREVKYDTRGPPCRSTSSKCYQAWARPTDPRPPCVALRALRDALAAQDLLQLRPAGAAIGARAQRSADFLHIACRTARDRRADGIEPDPETGANHRPGIGKAIGRFAGQAPRAARPRPALPPRTGPSPRPMPAPPPPVRRTGSPPSGRRGNRQCDRARAARPYIRRAPHRRPGVAPIRASAPAAHCSRATDRIRSPPARAPTSSPAAARTARASAQNRDRQT